MLRSRGAEFLTPPVDWGYKEGEQAPDFTLPDARGNAVRLSRLLRQGPVVMSFYRGQWCPYCHLALRAYQAWARLLEIRRNRTE